VTGSYWPDQPGADYGRSGYGAQGYGRDARNGASSGDGGYGGSGNGSGGGAGGRGRSYGGSYEAAPPRGSSRTPGRQSASRDQNGYPQNGYPQGGGGNDRGAANGRGADGRGNPYGSSGRPASSRSSGRAADGWDSAGSGAGTPADDPWSAQRGGGRGPRGQGPAAGANGGYRGGRSGEGAPAGAGSGRGYGPGQRTGSGQAAQDLRERLGVRGARSSGQGDGAGYGPAGNGAPRNGAGNGYGSAGYGGRGQTMERDSRRSGGGQDWDGNGRRPGGGGRGGRGGGPGGPGGPRGSGGQGERRTFKEWLLYGSWWRHWTLKKALAVGGGACAAVAILFIGAFLAAYSMTKIPSDTTVDASAAPSQVYYSDGKLMGTFSSGGPNRQILQAQQIPTVMKNAITAAEDRHFYTEGGISVTGILRAAYEDIKGGGYDQGGSTLTEQFVKNYYTGFDVDNSDKAAGDKFKEIMVSIKLAHEKSKSWIMTEYLNTVYFGQNAYGVGAASETYFGKPASKLDAAQAAMLAAMVNQPSYFNPDPHAGEAYQALLGRYQYVLTNMVRDGALPQAQATKLSKKLPKVHYHFDVSLSGYRGYLMQMVDQELTTTYGYSQRQIDSGGLKVHTTFSQSLMNALYKSVADNKKLMAEDGRPLPDYAHVGAVLEQPGTGDIMAIYGGPGYDAKNCAKVYCDLNMAEDAKQVGSSFKPYVLATAVSQGMNVQTSILNGYSPLWIPQGSSLADRLVLSSQTKPTPAEVSQQYYWPFNEADEDSGALHVAKAAAISSDPAFMDLAHRVGVQNIITMAKEMGVGQTPFNQDGNDYTALNDQFGDNSKSDTAGAVTIALGEGQLTAVEQASMLATFADDGVYHNPHVISQIIQAGNSVPIKNVTDQVLTAAQAADADYALSFDNVPGGTAYPDAAWPGRQIIGKTGTTQTAQDAWFVGAIPQDALVVTLFTNKQDSVSSAGSQTLDILPDLPGNATGGYGGAWPAKIWASFMLSEFGDTAPAALPIQNYTGFATWNQVGKIAKPHPHPTAPSPQPSGTCPGFGHGHGHQCWPGTPSPSPSPTGTSPTSPAPGCTPPQCQTPSPAPGAGAGAAAYVTDAGQPADKPAGGLLLAALSVFLL
jgi:membrane peptidoglycan carboxypeptidase